MRDVVFRDLAQDAPHDLARARFRQTGRKLDDVRARDGTDLTPDPGFLAILMREKRGGNPIVHWWARPDSREIYSGTGRLYLCAEMISRVRRVWRYIPIWVQVCLAYYEGFNSPVLEGLC